MKLLFVSCVGVIICFASLCVNISVADDEVYVCPSGTKWWIVNEQRIQVRNPKWGRTNVKLYYREIFWNPSIARDMVRLIKIEDGRDTTRKGWINVFTDTNEYKVLNNSQFTIWKAESTCFTVNERQINGALRLGHHVHEDGDIKYEYTTREAGENFVEGKTREIKLPDICAEEMLKVLRYIYTKTTSTDALNRLADKVLYVAEKYLLPEPLKVQCRKKTMKDNLSALNAIDYLLVADKYTLIELKSSAIDMIFKNMTEIRKQPHWDDFLKERG